MATLTDLRRLLNIKRVLLLITLNTIQDLISVSAIWEMKEQATTPMGIFALFDRYFCTRISLISYIIYISLYSFVLFLSIHRIAEDHQKYGVFYLVRLSRRGYALGKLSSCILFALQMAVLSVSQSFICHRLFKIEVPLLQYDIVLLLSFGLFLSCMEVGILSYSLTKSTNLSFVLGIAYLTVFSIFFSQKEIAIPMPNQISIPYFYPLAIAALLLWPIYMLLANADFVTTKMKE